MSRCLPASTTNAVHCKSGVIQGCVHNRNYRHTYADMTRNIRIALPSCYLPDGVLRQRQAAIKRCNAPAHRGCSLLRFQAHPVGRRHNGTF